MHRQRLHALHRPTLATARAPLAPNAPVRATTPFSAVPPPPAALSTQAATIAAAARFALEAATPNPATATGEAALAAPPLGS